PALAEASPPTLAVSGDFDGDGLNDAVVLESGVVSVELSEQRTIVKLEALPDTTGLVAIDIDKDGDIDLLSLNLDGRLREWNNEGSGFFLVWTTDPLTTQFPPPTVDSSNRASPHTSSAPLAATASTAGCGITADTRLPSAVYSHRSAHRVNLV